MPKSKVVSAARTRQERLGLAELPNAVEGQISEICRDLVVQVKRMRELQEQAEELRVVIRDWAGSSEPTSDRESASRARRR